MVKKLIVLPIIVTLLIFLYYFNQGKDIEDVLDHWFDKDDYHGIIYQRPKYKAGTWIIGDKKFNIVESTRIDEENGPPEVGQCVEIEIGTLKNYSMPKLEKKAEEVLA